MRRGEHLEDRIPDMKAKIEEYFGEVAGTEEHNGHELYVVEDVDAKNDFLLEATGRDAKSRRESMKRQVEDDAETPDGVS